MHRCRKLPCSSFDGTSVALCKSERASEGCRDSGFIWRRWSRAGNPMALIWCVGGGFRCLPTIGELLAVLLSGAWDQLPTSRAGSVVSVRHSTYLSSSVILPASISVVRLCRFGHSVKGVVFRGSLSSLLSDAVVFVDETRSSRRRCSRRGTRVVRGRWLR